nr:DUF6443 domain-containing protein [uncultured Draconibacterium sp.]
MIRIKLFSAILFAILAFCGNAQDAFVENNSVYTGTSEVVATQEVTLKPGFHAVSGCNVRVYIGSYPVSNYNDPSVTHINQFNSSGNSGRNYIHTTTMLENVTDENTLSSKLRIETIDYFDGLGRPIQNVTVQGAPDRKDIIHPIVYDEFGRETRKYLPYMGSNTNGSFVSGATSACATYYSSNKGYRNSDTYPYDSIIYESSPLNRELGVVGSGGNWQQHASSVIYSTNSTAVEGWSVTGNTLLSISSRNSSMYPANQLYITEFTDEDGHTTREFKDKLGRVVRKETDIDGGTLRTAYVYDDFGMLRCVVPPLASEANQTGYCYYYLYDGRRRMIEKQLPGAGPVYMVYDARDRLVMTKDAVNGWMGTIYDALNRPVMTCTVPSASGTGRNTLQTAFNDFVSNAQASNTGTNLGYTVPSNIFTSISYTFSESNVQTVTFYDNYNFLQAPDFRSEAVNYAYGGAYLASDPVTRSEKTKGLVTGTLTRVIDNAVSNGDNLLLSVSYYDDYGRPIRVISDNHLGGKDKVYTDYDFVGKPELTVTTHNTDGTGEDVKMTSTYKYDHQGRLLTEKFKLNNDAEITLVANEYGELGELTSKYLHGTTAAEKFNQRVDYKYNIKGWLTNMNEVNNLGKQLFGLSLQYGDGTGGFYNGNIWKMDWQNNGTGPKRYTFDYYRTNGLKTAGYADGSGFSSNTNAFKTEYSYDGNGNIENLQRSSNGKLIDNLNYTYVSTSNKLRSVDDVALAAYKDGGYKEGVINYSYDLNGNMITDHRGVDIDYNFLNLPKSATYNQGNYLGFVYSAGGTKLRKNVNSQTAGNKVVDYVGPFLYEDNDLKVIFTSAGRIVKIVDGSNVLWKYEYNLTDHLGNVRAVFAAHNNGIAELMQQTDYYPFGLVMNQQEKVHLEEVKNRYLYNGKELQDDNFGVSLDWYDYGARFYDPALGRWHVIDALASDFASWTPYHYVHNNPILLIDPTGMAATRYEDEEGNFLAETNDGNQNTVVIKNDKKEQFQTDYSNAAINGTQDGFKENSQWITKYGGGEQFESTKTTNNLGIAIGATSTLTAKLSETIDNIIHNRISPRQVNLPKPSVDISLKTPLGNINGNSGAFGKLSKGLKGFGYAAAGYGVVSAQMSYKAGEISKAQRNADVVFSGVGLAGWQGATISLSYELGKSYGPSKWYGSDNSKWFK